MSEHSIGLPATPAVQIGNVPATMSSREIAELCEKRHDHVMRDIKVMLEALQIPAPRVGGSYLGDNGKQLPCYKLPRDLTMTLVTGYSIPLRKKVIDRLDELERSSSRAMSPAEMFLQNAQAMVDIERRQEAQGKAIVEISDVVARVELAQTVMSSRPSNAEALKHIHQRIGKKYGLSAVTIDAVIRHIPYAPKPAGTVRNSHVDAQNSTFTVYWVKDISNTFRQFVSECSQVTATMWTHPQIDGRFKMTIPQTGVSA